MIILLVEYEGTADYSARGSYAVWVTKWLRREPVEAAIEILRVASFDLLIADMVMPKAGGGEVIKAVSVGDHYLPAIFISGYTQESVVWEVESMD